MTPEELAEKKKAQIESEFKRFKLISELRARKAKKLKDAEEAARIEQGLGDEQQQEEKKEPELEIKLAAKARRKFQKIDASGKSGLPMPKGMAKVNLPSRWNVKKEGPAPEIVNRPKLKEKPEALEENVPENEDENENEEAIDDVKIRAEKWDKKLAEECQKKNGQKARKKKMLAKECGEEDEAEMEIRAKELREHFERITEMLMADDVSEEKQQELQVEMMKIQREKQQMDLEQKNGGSKEKEAKAGVQVAAKHASKMTNKWEKIMQKKEKEAKRTQLAPKESKPPSKWTVKTNERAEIVNRTAGNEEGEENMEENGTKEVDVRQKDGEEQLIARPNAIDLEAKEEEKMPGSEKKKVEMKPENAMAILPSEDGKKVDQLEDVAFEMKLPLKMEEKVPMNEGQEEAEVKEEEAEEDEEEEDNDEDNEDEEELDDEDWEWEYEDEEEDDEEDEEGDEEEESGQKAPPPPPPKPKLP